MEQYPGNSKRPAQARADEPKKIDRVVQSSVVRRKTPLGKRFAQNFMGGDARNVGAFMAFDVLLPAVRDMIFDAFTGGLERSLFPDSTPSRGRGRSRGGGGFGGTPYHQMSGNRGSRSREEPRREISRRARATHSFDEIIIPNRHEAEEVLDRLESICERYEAASVADLYAMLGSDTSPMDYKWGWDSVRDAYVSRVHGREGGYLLNLPKPEPLD